jgi:acetyl-CoA carboxylase carboxyl transferase subunit alpha
MVKRQFDYDKKYRDLLKKIQELKELSETTSFNLSGEIDSLEDKMMAIRDQKYSNLSPWEKILLVRNPQRPTSYDYIEYVCDEWIELHGDRCFGDDKAIVAGIGSFEGQPVTVFGHQRGKSTGDNIHRNFGMPHPEGYRKIHRLLSQAEKFNRPVINLIDTQGAYPGIGAEERGQAWSISQVLMVLSHIKVPVVSVVTGEGGSGGALALAVCDRLLMLSNAVFSVATAEACASILWQDTNRVEETAAAMKITAQDLHQLNIVDRIIEEPVGGAQEQFEIIADNIKNDIRTAIKEIMNLDRDQLLEQRYHKLRKIGEFNE